MVMYGADADALRATGERFVESSAALRRHRAELSSAFGSAGWLGADADASRAEWQQVSVPALVRTGAFMDTLGRSLLAHAAAQRNSSAARGGGATAAVLVGGVGGAVAGLVDDAGTAVGGLLDGVGDVVTDLVDDAGTAVGGLLDGVGDVVTDLVDDVDGFFDRVFGGSAGAEPIAAPAVPIDGLRPESFPPVEDGRAGVVAAMGGFADESRIGRDEIEIRALDNGRFVVVLPGVTDLSQGFDQFARQVREDGLFGVPDGARDAYDSWADNDEPTVRKMRYAYEAALRDDTTTNEYSTVVIAAMEAAGVPAGSDVMIVGHSFGAYTAIDLAVEPTFNRAAGATDGYHVNVTHVVAAGAETDWRFDEVPGATNTLVLNNRWDAVYQAENLLHRDASPTESGHLEVEFWGGRDGYGHDEHNYIDWVSRSDHREVQVWLDHAGEGYSSGGTRVSVPVPDPDVR